MRTLIVNAGSTNLKLSVLDGERELFATRVDDPAPASAVRAALGEVRARKLLPVDAVGHRVVHGGPEFTKGVRITDEVVAKLAALNDLAPLHNPPALDALAEAGGQLPDVPHVACFDTAFHSSIPNTNPAAATYPLPRKWTAEWGIRKYGFHGLSHAYCSRRAAEMMGRVDDPTLKVVVAHLGGGCSLSAVLGGFCFDTTMGFTPLDGLMMGTRCGSIDPGVILHVMRRHGLSVDQVERALNKESGLLGVSGVSDDLREVRKAALGGNARASAALEMFNYRVAQGVAAMAAAIGGMDALVFTGGIGENDPAARYQACHGLGFLRAIVEARKNDHCVPDQEVSADNAKVRVLVIHTREDLTIAREVKTCLENA